MWKVAQLNQLNHHRYCSSLACMQTAKCGCLKTIHKKTKFLSPYGLKILQVDISEAQY